MERLKAIYHLIYSLLAIIRYQYPARKLFVIAVTGTSGKTTTVHLIYSILKRAGLKVSLISSIQAIIGGKELDIGFHVTTPTPFMLQKLLRKSLDSGDKYLVVEASSHGIAQYRMLGTNVKIAVLTNIAHEHLDWHRTFDHYRDTKLSLLGNSIITILNKDDSSYPTFNSKYRQKSDVLTYSLYKKSADYNLNKYPIKTNLQGDFNLQNALAATAVGITCGLDLNLINKGLQEFKGIKGRFELINNNRGFRILIDFAHKPNAMESLLTTLLKNYQGRLISVFGCAGERDTAKRYLMGEISARLAHISVLTAEDPRSESAEKIINEITKGCKKANASELTIEKAGKLEMSDKSNHYFVRIPNRSEAIYKTINKIAKKGDTVAFLGKGHEKSMCYGKIEYPWSEHEEINKALAGK